MLTIQNTEQLNCTSPCVIMSTVYLRAEGGIGHLSCQSIVLIKGHIVGRISNPLGIKQILVIEQYPEVISERQLIQASVYSYLIGNTCVFA